MDQILMAPSIEVTAADDEAINCILVSDRDPMTGRLRTGAELRYLNPPALVNYDLYLDRFVYPKYLGHYRLDLLSVPLSAARLFTEVAFPIENKNRDYSLVHSLYWSLHRFKMPWIHENDQSLGQYFTDYIHFDGFVKKGIVEMSATILNSSLCKAVVVWSNWAKKGYTEDGVDPSKIRIIPPSHPVIDYRKKHSTTNILFIGRDYKRKGGSTVLEVFTSLEREFPDARLIFIGKASDPGTVRRIKEDPKISYFEYVSKKSLLENIFPVTDLFFLPTRAEAYGMSILEAMSRGIPVVSSNISAIPEAVQNGVSGFVCRPEDTGCYYQRLALLLQDEKLRGKMGQNAQDFVAKEFSSQKIGKELYKLYLTSAG